MLITSRAFLVAGLHHLSALVEEGTYEIVEVVLEAATVGAVVEDDAGQLLTGRFLDGGQPMLKQGCGILDGRVVAFQDGCDDRA